MDGKGGKAGAGKDGIGKAGIGKAGVGKAGSGDEDACSSVCSTPAAGMPTTPVATPVKPAVPSLKRPLQAGAPAATEQPSSDLKRSRLQPSPSPMRSPRSETGDSQMSTESDVGAVLDGLTSFASATSTTAKEIGD